MFHSSTPESMAGKIIGFVSPFCAYVLGYIEIETIYQAVTVAVFSATASWLVTKTLNSISK